MKRAVTYYILLVVIALLALSACRKNDDDYDPERHDGDSKIEQSIG
ncbi:MAG: hypothetical protein AAF361_02035 [Bacteroidota bacterium]